VVTSRGDVHYAVTEYGVAYLHGKTLRQRAEALIQIAHRDFRDELMAGRPALRGFREPPRRPGGGVATLLTYGSAPTRGQPCSHTMVEICKCDRPVAPW